MSNDHSIDVEIGAVFTPMKWGKYACERYGITNAWLNGAQIFDPTMGEGDLLLALIESGLNRGVELDDLPMQNLYGNEVHPRIYQKAQGKLASFGLSSNQISNEDFFKLKPRSFDFIFGNPPWLNYHDLPESYKPFIRDKFKELGLVSSGKIMLLGNSRIDISALVVQLSIIQFLAPMGKAVFFLPFSLFLNEGASNTFRNYQLDSTVFGLKELIDLNDVNAFPGISTRYGIACFERDQITQYPVSYVELTESEEHNFVAQPISAPTSALQVIQANDARTIEPYKLHELQRARQGINTCGRNALFFFNELEFDGEHGIIDGHLIPKKYIHPLLCSANFKDSVVRPLKWVLLPYNSAGKVLNPSEIDQEKGLWNYLNSIKESLITRKGTMINSHIDRGNWWALLGVGPYNFAPYKVVWEAYGRSSFKPRIFEGKYQANQSLQAFIPCKSLEQANEILDFLGQDEIEHYLKSFRMDGSMNWAQPGKINQLFKLSS